MRIILSLIALFSLCGALRAQEYKPSHGRELPRGDVWIYPSQQEAASPVGGDNRYLTQLTEWARTGNSFTTSFTVPFAWANRQVLLRLDRASADYQVRVNGREAAYNADPNAPAEFNITPLVQEGRNTVEIAVSAPSPVAPLESWKESPAPAIGPAWVMSQPTLRVRDVLVKTWRNKEEDGTLTAEVGIVAKTSSLNPRTSRIYYELLTPSGETAAAGFKDMTLDMRREDTLRFLTRIPANLQWTTELPTQYTLRLKTRHEGRDAEFIEQKLGFRALEFKEGQIAVNGTPVTLRVREVPPTIDENEITRLREDGYNTLRLLPGAVPPSLFEVCDRLGVYVIPQAPIDTRRSGTSRRKGGNPSNDPAWMSAYLERTQDSYHTSKRHPSVVAFQIAKQSANGINLYEAYLGMKRMNDVRPFIYPDAAGEWNTDRLVTE